MSKIAIIGASYLQLPLYLKAKELGFTTVGFAWEEGAVAKDVCDKFYPISIIEKEMILGICEKEKIDGILTIASDVAVATVNYISSKLNLWGNSENSALYSTNKFIMRQKLQAAGLNCPNFFLINKVSDLKEILGTLNFPAIVKPVDRSGSKGVAKVISLSELEEATLIALEASLSHQAIVEEFIEGQEVSVEIISFNGVHYELTITDKVTSGAPHFVELAHHQPSMLPKNLQEQIFNAAKIGLNALEIKNGASHPEFIISKKGIFVTEIGSRMGGDFIGSDLVFLSTGYDFLKGALQVSIGAFEIPKKRFQKHSGVYFISELTPQIATFIEDNKYHSSMVKYEHNSNELKPLKQSADRNGYFIYQDNKKLDL